MHTKIESIPTEIANDEMVLREMHLGNMNVGYETFSAHVETDEMFKDLPDGRCQSSHWGFLIEGQMTLRFEDEEEVVEAGEVYYIKPGHNVTIEAGTKLVEFSPLDESYEDTLEAASEGVKKMEASD
ncbi:hypothetical protein [Haladaptatus sp. ZSTT2]|uniref:hypothetical protein n=1 Tax=Haladaptatus sp. ZSTT2 TaxID=3120515 RepID=UPI00300F05EF